MKNLFTSLFASIGSRLTLADRMARESRITLPDDDNYVNRIDD